MCPIWPGWHRDCANTWVVEVAQVSIAHVEMIDRLQVDLVRVCEGQAQEAAAVMQRLQAFREQALSEVQASASFLEQSLHQETVAEHALAEAFRCLADEQSRLAESSNALYACEASQPVDEYCTAGCGAQEQEQALAERTCEYAAQDLERAEQDLRDAVTQRLSMQARLDQSRQVLALHDNTAEDIGYELGVRLASCLELLEQVRVRVAQAVRALDQYLAMSPAAAQFRDWLRWIPTANKPVTPDQLAQRMNLSPQAQQAFMQYLAQLDPDVQRLLARYRAEHGRCSSAMEVHKLQLKVRRHLSGLYAEKVVEYALRPIARVVRTQQRTDLAGGRYTRTDLVFSELTVPVILGRGQGMAAPAGGSIAVEVKCGKAAYLRAQREHMQFQAGGHQQASASMTVCSRDIHLLSADQQRELRQSLRDSGSPLIGMLPYKDEIDELCWSSVCTPQTEKGVDDD